MSGELAVPHGCSGALLVGDRVVAAELRSLDDGSPASTQELAGMQPDHTANWAELMTSDFAIGRRGGLVEMVVTGMWSGDAESALTTGGVDSLVLNYALGFEEPTLEFLRGLPIRQLVVIDRRLRDLDPLYSLSSSLESLQLTTDPSLVLDVSAFDRLVELGADWAQVRASVGSALQLRKLFLTRYGWDDFTPLAGLRELMALTLKDRYLSRRMRPVGVRRRVGSRRLRAG